MTIAQSSVNVEWIYTQFLKSEWNQFSEYVFRNNFNQKGFPYLKLFLGFLMKYNPLYKWQYLSQIKLDLYETFRTTFWECPKMIQHSKVDQIILNSSQEPSTSSKYDHILDALLITLGSCKSAYTLGITYNVDSWCKFWYQRWPKPPKLKPGGINIF